ncbi:hypothetical protein [Aegicerativicinus sediminis]
MKFTLILILLLPIFNFTCSPEIIDNKRAVVVGNVTDSDGTPLEGIPIRMSTSNYILGYGVSNAEGYFEFISLLSEESRLEVDVNFQSQTIDFTKPKFVLGNEALDNQFTLGTIVLERPALLDLKIENSSGINSIVTWSLEYSEPNCMRYLNTDDTFPLDLCYQQNFVSGELNSTETSFQTEIQTIANKDAIFTYELENGSIETITISLNPGINTFSFEF